ncbi:hypothetical protein FJ251_06730 [bacterium]|nr:hypothetical protein [bacterium]
MKVDHRCLSTRDLETLVDLPPTAPARQALLGCPRCQTQLEQLEEFLHDRSRPAGSRPDDAAWRLQLALAAELRGAGADRRPNWLRRPRLAWGVAASLALAGVLFAVVDEWGWRPRETTPRWRGEPMPATILLLPVGREAADTLRLSWRAQAGAARYRVDIWDADFRSLLRASLADTLLRVDAARLRAKAAPPFAWQVTALATAEGAVLAHSPIATLSIP